MRIAYFDCFSGASGNMILGALLDAGLPLDTLKERLGRIHLHGYELKVERVQRQALAGTHADVVLQEGHDHHGRHLHDITELINASTLSDRVKEQAIAVFNRLARAEARAHGSSPDHVHFHEVGAVDAIVDIVGAVAGLEALGIEKVYGSAVNTGRGRVRAAHGELPVPAPGTLALLEGWPIYSRGEEFELLTPTGAAILTTLGEPSPHLPPMVVERAGYGAGTRETAAPNLLRLFVGTSPERVSAEAPERVMVLEANLDDMNPQFFDYVMQRLFAVGCLDVFLVPIQMKKNRPGVILSVICAPERVAEASRIIFEETTTLGLRMSELARQCLRRSFITVNTEYGAVQVKVAYEGERPLHLMPEYEDCRRAAAACGAPIATVHARAGEAARQALATGSE